MSDEDTVTGVLENKLHQAEERIAELERQLAERSASLAQLMIKHSFATGHGDTFDDLIAEFDWQLAERSAQPDHAALDEVVELQADLRDANRKVMTLRNELEEAKATIRRIRLADAEAYTLGLAQPAPAQEDKQ